MMGGQQVRHWRRSRLLMVATIALWLIFSFAIHFFVEALDEVAILGIPLGFVMTAQGSVIAFVLIAFWFAWRQNAIDENHDVSEG